LARAEEAQSQKEKVALDPKLELPLIRMKNKSRTPKPSAASVRWKSDGERTAVPAPMPNNSSPGNLHVICHLDSVFGPRISLGFRAANL